MSLLQPPSPHDPHPRRRIALPDAEISFVDTGQGAPIVFLHGNPTWSYLWRNVIPHVADLGRCLAPDLAGMGQSSPFKGDGRFAEHAAILDDWFDALDLRGVVLVLHDWGSALGFDWARRHADRVRAIAYMEALVQPRLWSDFVHGRDAIFRALRSERGEAMALDDNFFVETVLPRSVMRALTQHEMQAYRAPFADRAARRATLQWARELPIEGEPPDVVQAVDAYGRWMAQNQLPKLFVNVEPGALLTGRAREFCRSWPNQQETTVSGIHYVQEDSPVEIGQALRGFVLGLGGVAA
jgi:haloalkane dehalogenase